MDLGNGLGHLTYSTLVHPGDDWEQMWASLTTYVPKVKARIAPNQRFGVSLRLSANSAQTLVDSAAEREKLKKFLGDNDMYLYTVNAFPYGAFKGTIVKEQVYEPDWRSEERTRYTINVADVLADVCSGRHRAFDPERAARFQAARDRQRRGRELHRPRLAGRGASRRARGAHRAHRHSSRSSPSPSASSKPPTRRSIISPIISIPGPRRKNSPSSRTFRFRRRMARCAGISAWCSISATRRWNTRTSPSRCRSWSMPASRSSSCRKPPRCTCRK